MIRFKVVRASRLLLAVAVVLLAIALALLGIRFSARRKVPPVSGTANLVEAEIEGEAKAATVFASPSGEGPETAKPSEGGGIEIEIVRRHGPQMQRPGILIYHTHTHEAYEQVPEDPYEAIETWRTVDADHSVVRVGEALAESLRGYGFDVIHDATDHEGTDLSTAYTRSLETLLAYDRDFDLYIDLHRDAYSEGEAITVDGMNGEEMAPLMILIGNGEGFDQKPYYVQNHAFGCMLEKRINSLEPGLCKPVLVKDGRYNQHIGVFSILVEVGHNRNTLRQALNSVQPLARAIESLMLERQDAQLVRMKEAYDAARDG